MMKKTLFSLLLLPALSVVAFASSTLPIIPRPQSVVMDKDEALLHLNKNLTIYYEDASLKELADLLAADLLVTHMIEARPMLLPAGKAPAGKGDVFLLASPQTMGQGEYSLRVGEDVLIEASSVDAFHYASLSLLQAINSRNQEDVVLPRVVIHDAPFRQHRQMMVDVKNQWHSVEVLKDYIRLARFYKVNYFFLHTGAEQWIAGICEQTEKIPVAKRQALRYYTKAELDELIAFALSQGVHMLPSHSSCPHINGMENALKTDFVEGDEYASFLDEVIGGGAYDGDMDDERFWAFIRKATHLAMDQYAAAYPGAFLPFYHIGPVQGEGGMSPQVAARVTGFIVEHSPETKMMCWNGIGAKDAHLSPLKEHIAIAFYQQWGGATVNEYMEEGWNVVNAAYSPLYIVGTRSRTQEQVYMDWNYFRSGHDGFLNGAFPYDNINWFNFADCGEQSQVMGGMFTTWEIKKEDHMPQMEPRLPAFAENAWEYEVWPYEPSRYADFKLRYEVQHQLLKRFLSSPVAPDPVQNLAATDKVFEDAVHLIWTMEKDNAIAYDIYRASSNDFADAKKIAKVEDRHYIDQDVKVGQDYYYWVLSYNYFGQASPQGPVKGSVGVENMPALAYEPFDYPCADALFSASDDAQVEGWVAAWQLDSQHEGSQLSLVDSLQYENLPVSGKALKVYHQVDKSKIATVLKRQLSHAVGTTGTSTWVSFLFKPEKLGNGHYLIGMGGAKDCMGKSWGSSLAAEALKEGETYFVVYQVVNTNGKDVIYSWLNPSLQEQPQPEAASRIVRSIDLQANLDKIRWVELNSQTYGMGQYVLDELRLGSSWMDVIGGVDLAMPTPQRMTWELPPMLVEGDPTSAQMTSVIAEDESGVQYYFEECSGNPGGTDSGWIDTNFYVDHGLEAGHTYSYRVKARDKSAQGNESAYSDPIEIKV